MVDAYRNNFHLLRLVLAGLVMLSHGNYLFGTGFDWPLFHSAEWAVNGFFIISGLLISWSIDRQFEWRSYGIKRFARIYPLYGVVIFAQLVTLLFFSGAGVSFGEIGTYLAANLITLNFIKPYVGDMVDFPFNGSLWTIKIEVMFYIALPIFIWFVKRFGMPFLIASWVAAFIFRYTMDDYSIQIARQLPGAMTFFIAGYILHHYGQQIIGFFTHPERVSDPGSKTLDKTLSFRGVLRLFPLCAALALADILLPSDYGYQLVMLFVLMAAIYGVAFHLPALTMRYDISYGIYLIHFPLFATLVHIGWLQTQPEMAFVLGCMLVCVLSFLATIIVEEPMIRWGKEKAKRYETNRTKL
jgi:peptidoglycan/LPS O-acetylase OafA/YrhL